MSQLIEQPIAVTEDTKDPGLESANFWQQRFADFWNWKGKHFAFILVFALFFMFNNYMRMFFSDIWGHVAYGNWILDHRALPTDDPFVALAEGMPVKCTAWLSQILLASAGRLGGPEAYSALFAVSITLTYLVLARVVFLQTGRLGIAAAGAFLAWGINFGRHAVIRPEMFGGLCFAILLWLVVRSDPGRTRQPGETDCELSAWDKLLLWAGVPALFLLWANLHGSFIVGFAVLGGYALGRGIETLWRERRLSALFADAHFRRLVWLTELAVLATLANPYGLDLLLHTVMFPSNPNLKDILEWYTLEMVSLEGIAMGCSWVMLLVLLRHSRLRVAVSDVILLAIFTLAVCLRVRMIAWYGAVWMLVVAPHLKDVWDQLTATPFANICRKFQKLADYESSRFAMFGLLVIWLAFAFSPASFLLLGGTPALGTCNTIGRLRWN